MRGDIEQIHTVEFDSYEKAIALYGTEIVRVRLAESIPVRPLPCNLNDDMILPVVPRIKCTEVVFRLRQFQEGNRYFWRYCRS